MPRSIYNRPLKAKRPDSKRPDRSEAKLLASMFENGGMPSVRAFSQYKPIYDATLGEGYLPRRMGHELFEKTWNTRRKLGKLIVEKGIYDFDTHYNELEPVLKEIAAHLRKNPTDGNKPVFNDATIREAIYEIDKTNPPISLIDWGMGRSWGGKPLSEILKMRGLKRS